jgi:cobalt-zinc-cadmium resistance protein CzcA
MLASSGLATPPCGVPRLFLLPPTICGIGSQVQKPLAVVVVGGSFLAPLLILLVLPVLIDLFSRRRTPVGTPERLVSPAE